MQREQQITVTVNPQDLLTLIEAARDASDVSLASIFEFIDSLERRTLKAVQNDALRARTPIVLDKLQIGGCILWDKDSEISEGQVEFYVRELVIDEFILTDETSALVRIKKCDDYEYLVLVKGVLGWYVSVLTPMLDEALEFFPKLESTSASMYSSLCEKIKLIAYADGMTKEQKKEQVQSILMSEGAQGLSNNSINYPQHLRSFSRFYNVEP